MWPVPRWRWGRGQHLGPRFVALAGLLPRGDSLFYPWAVAKYSKAQLAKNRKSVTGVALVALGLVAFSFVASGFSFGRLVSGSLVAAAFVGVMWWLFASSGASKIDGTWVDGFTSEGNWHGGFNPSRRSYAEPAQVQDGVCPDCRLAFGTAGGTAHAGCKTELA